MKKTLFYALLFIFVFAALRSSAQTAHYQAVPNGFHLAILGEGNFAQSMNAMNVAGSCPQPATAPAMGWKSGVELSYHFLDYVGVSVGFTYGTRRQLQYHPILYDDQTIEDVFPSTKWYAHDFQIPIKLSVSVPFNEHWALFAATGVNFRNIATAIGYANAAKQGDAAAEYYAYRHGLVERGRHSCGAGDMDPYNVYEYTLAEQKPGKLKTDLLLNVGFTYRLPYSDLIRVSLLANFSLGNDVCGTYVYPLRQTNGALNYRHNLMGMEVAYVLCFKYKDR